MNIGKTLREIRKEKNISQVKLSKITGITQASISQIESGNTRPGTETMNKICSALGVPEPMVYIMSLQKSDIHPKNHSLFDLLHPIIKKMISQLHKI